MAYHWYVLQSKVHKEEALWKRLHAKGYEVFFPCLMIHRKRATKTRSPRRAAFKIRPLFPGYMFVRLDLEQVPVSSFQWMPDAVGLVDFDDRPTWVPDYFIEAIQSHLGKVSQIGERFVADSDVEELFSSYDGHPSPLSSPAGNPKTRDPETQGPGAGEQANRAIYDSRLSGKERVSALYRLLREIE